MPEAIPAPRPAYRASLGARARVVGRLRRDDAPWWIAEAALVAALAVQIARWHTLVNLDCALYLQCARLLLAGQVPYVDFVDINPPWIVYTMAPVVWVAHVLAIPPTRAFMLAVGGLIALSWLELRALLRRSGPALRAHERGAIACAWIATSLVIGAFGDLGEREHLFMLAFVPFMLLRQLRYEGRAVPRGLALLVGLQAGAGLCLKPDFVVMAAAVELALRVGNGTRRWCGGGEIAAVLLVGSGYAAHWALVPAAMRAAYFGRWVPAIVRGYDAYSVPLRTMLAEVLTGDNVMSVAGIAIVLGLWLARRGRVATRALLLAFGVLGAVSLVDHVAQRREWSYHLTPFYMAGLFAAALLWVEAGRALERVRALRRLRFDLAVLPYLGAFAAAMVCVALSLHVPRRDRPLADAVRRWTAPGERVLVLATSVSPAYPTLTLLDRLPGSRYLWDFPIAFFLHEPPPAARADAHRFEVELGDDIDRLEPRLIALDTDAPGQGCPDGFDLAAYLERAGIMARVRAAYAEQPPVTGLRLFVRKRS